MKVLKDFTTTTRRFSAGVELAPGDVPDVQIPALIKAGYLPKPPAQKRAAEPDAAAS